MKTVLSIFIAAIVASWAWHAVEALADSRYFLAAFAALMVVFNIAVYRYNKR